MNIIFAYDDLNVLDNLCNKISKFTIQNPKNILLNSKKCFFKALLIYDFVIKKKTNIASTIEVRKRNLSEFETRRSRDKIRSRRDPRSASTGSRNSRGATVPQPPSPPPRPALLARGVSRVVRRARNKSATESKVTLACLAVELR